MKKADPPTSADSAGVPAAGKPPPPEPRLETRSPVLRRIILSATGLASTVLVALGVELLGSPWNGLSPLRAAGWAIIMVALLVLAGWWASTLAARVRLTKVYRLSQPIPGPAAPLRANWSPGPAPPVVSEAQAAVDAVVTALQKASVVVVSGSNLEDPTTIARAAAHRVMHADVDAPPGEASSPWDGEAGEPHHLRAAYIDLGDHAPGDSTSATTDETTAYAAASALFPAFGMVVPDCSDDVLRRAARHLIQELRAEPTLVVLAHVGRPEAVEWLLAGWPSDGSLPWLIIIEPAAGPWSSSARPEADIRALSVEARVLARSIAELPPCELGADALSAVYAVVMPDATTPLIQLLTELRRRHIVECSSTTMRYRMPPHMRAPAMRIDWPEETVTRWPAALPALLQYYADLCDTWLTALQTEANAAKAAQWFHAEEPMLYTLVVETSPSEHKVAIDQLTRIADALDVWYARQHKPVRSLHVARALYEVAGQAGYPVQRTLAETRQRAAHRRGAPGRSPEPTPHLPRHELHAAMRSRLFHEDGLDRLAAAQRTNPPDRTMLDQAGESLKKAWLALPRADVTGAVAVAVDLAVVHLHQGRLDLAGDRLDLAEILAGRMYDVPAQAHVHELQGIVAWAGGERYRAVDLWLNAYGLYCRLEEQRGESRCLQHLATAVLADPSLMRLALPEPDDPDTDPFDEKYALLNAKSWLERSVKLRPEQDDDCLARHYLAEVDRRLPPRSEPGLARPPRIPDQGQRTGRLERLGKRVDRLFRRPARRA